MSVGKIVRKIVKKWLKKDNETSNLEPQECELFSDVADPVLLCSEPCHQQCMFCVDPDSLRSGDLNRNVHISDEMGFTRNSSEYGKRCRSDNGTPSDSYLSLGGKIPFTNDDDDYDKDTDFSVEATCHSSQSPVPICVCEKCYIFVSSHLSLQLPPTFSKSHTDAAAAGRPFYDSSYSSGCSPDQHPIKDDMHPVRLEALVKSGAMKETTDCNKDSSISRTSNRQIHSVASPKPSCYSQQLQAMYSSSTSLPPSVHMSLDGEEGFFESQRRLLYENHHCHVLEQKGFCPPPNKTICHVAK